MKTHNLSLEVITHILCFFIRLTGVKHRMMLLILLNCFQCSTNVVMRTRACRTQLPS